MAEAIGGIISGIGSIASSAINSGVKYASDKQQREWQSYENGLQHTRDLQKQSNTINSIKDYQNRSIDANRNLQNDSFAFQREFQNSGQAFQKGFWERQTDKASQAYNAAGLPSYLAYTNGITPRGGFTQMRSGANPYISKIPGNPMSSPYTAESSAQGWGNIIDA